MLITFSANPSGQLYVFRHDRHAFGVNNAQITVLEQLNKIIFAGTLESVSCISCKMETSLEVLSDFPD